MTIAIPNKTKLSIYRSPGELLIIGDGDDQVTIRVDDVNRKANNIRMTVFADPSIKIKRGELE